MIFHVIPFIFFSTICFGMEQSSLQPMLHNDINNIEQRDSWESEFKHALVYADCNLLNELVRSPYFTPECAIEAPDLNGIMINPITFSFLYTKNNTHADLLACIEILYNNGIPLIMPQKNIIKTFFSPFLWVKNAKDFQYFLKLHVQKKQKIIDPCYLKETGKNILERETIKNYPVFLELISKATESGCLITLYKEYEPNVLNNQNILRIAYLGFAYTYVTYYAIENNLITTDIKIENDTHFIKNIVPFLIANGAEIYQEVEGFSLDDIKDHILQIINRDPSLYISSLPPLEFLSDNTYENCNILYRCGINMEPLIDVINKSIPSEEELIKDAVRLALNVEGHQSKIPSLRDVMVNNRKPNNVLQGLIARQYKNTKNNF